MKSQLGVQNALKEGKTTKFKMDINHLTYLLK